MRTISTPLQTALATDGVALAQLVRFGLPSAAITLCTANRAIEFEGEVYRGVGELGSMSAIKSASGEVHGVQFELAGGASEQVALALDGGDEFAGCQITVRVAVLDAATHQVVDAPIEWAGYGDTFVLDEDGTSARIKATAESNEVDLLRSRPLTTSDADHQAIWPGDKFCAYVQEQTGKPFVWPAREWFFK